MDREDQRRDQRAVAKSGTVARANAARGRTRSEEKVGLLYAEEEIRETETDREFNEI